MISLWDGAPKKLTLRKQFYLKNEVLRTLVLLNRNVEARQKKASLVSRNQPGEDFFYHSPAHVVKCISECTHF